MHQVAGRTALCHDLSQTISSPSTHWQHGCYECLCRREFVNFNINDGYLVVRMRVPIYSILLQIYDCIEEGACLWVWSSWKGSCLYLS